MNVDPQPPQMTSSDRVASMAELHALAARRPGAAYATMMVHVPIGGRNARLLEFTAYLAGHFQARVVGIATSQLTQFDYSSGYVPVDLIEQDRVELEEALQAAETEFRAALRGRIAVTAWRSCLTYTPSADYVAREARCADLVVIGALAGLQSNDPRRLDVGSLLMQAGRPILLVPPDLDRLRLETVVIGWRDTPEARRAVAASLPLLIGAGRVILVEIAHADELDAARARLADVGAWLASHGVEAGCIVEASTGDDAAGLAEIAQTANADLFVAGAYGHSRVREWAFGGVTRDLLLSPDRCSLLSH
ncbi:MAG: universal stress protein [Gemmatimonadaceae bacterium]|nr:universal stress protein [Acetobacteraceae bacterium]